MRRKEDDLARRRLPCHNTFALSKYTHRKENVKMENVTRTTRITITLLKLTTTRRNSERRAFQSARAKFSSFVAAGKSGFRDGIIKC